MGCRLVLVIAFTVFAIFAGTIADQAHAGTIIGAKVGLAHSRLNMTTWGGSGWFDGLTGGPFISVAFNELFSIQPGLFYCSRGGTYRDQSSYPDGSLAWVDEAAYTADYIEIPVLIRYRLSSNPGRWPVLMAGPMWRTAVSSELVWNGRRSTDWANAADFAFMLGAGVESMVGSLVASFEVQYSWSLSGVGSSESFTDDAAMEGWNVLFALGYLGR